MSGWRRLDRVGFRGWRDSLGHTASAGTLILAFVGLATVAAAQDDSLAWPRQIPVDSGKITIYQPQVDSFEGNRLASRAAVAYTPTGGEPVFGAASFAARLEVDRANRIVQIVDIEVTDLRSPDGTSEHLDRFSEIVRTNLNENRIVLSLDRLIASVDAIEDDETGPRAIKTDPPTVLFETEPALLVVLDGEPVMRDIDGTPYRAVINTPYPLIHDPQSGTYYLKAAESAWYRSSSLEGPWSFDKKPPKKVRKLVQRDKEIPDEMADIVEGDGGKVTADSAPKIIVATEPTELIVAEGEPRFEPLVEDVLVMGNTDNHVFMNVSEQEYYVVLSGRWYRADSMQGPWSFTAADELPAAFARIPEDSDSAAARVHVAGTPEASEALLDAQIPQTAAVEKGRVDLDVEYDGQPKFEPVEETSLQYAVNTGDSVLESGAEYYCVRDGVWYVAPSAEGPWSVAEEVPPGVEEIPPSSPVHNVKYVYIYDTTPEVVYVGYTPGYVGSYIYGPTIVYGTGWYYRPWVTPHYYYPRPYTWGFHISYNPWSGWGFGLSWSSGPFHFGFYSGGYWHHNRPWHYPSHGWWGPGGYRPGWGGNQVNIGNINIGGQQNIYRRRSQAASIQHTSAARARIDPATARARAANVDRGAVAARGGNNVYAGRDGEVYRKTAEGWQGRGNGEWRGSGGQAAGTRPSSRPQAGRSYLDGQHSSRPRGQTRTQQYQRSRSASPRRMPTRGRR